MDISLRIVLARDYLRADAGGKVDLASARELARRLVRPDHQIDRARFMEDYAQNRSVPIGAFTDLDEAVRWLGHSGAAGGGR